MLVFSGTVSITEASSPSEVGPDRTGIGTAGRDHFIFRLSSSATVCHGFWHDAALVLPSVLFVLYLGFHARSNIKKLSHRRSSVMIGYYGLLWFAVLLNLAWCFLQVWQCPPGKQVAWNLLSLFATSAMLFLEISIVAFLLEENYASCLETLARTFMVSGLFVSVDLLLKVIFIFGFGVPLFLDVEIADRGKWGVWFTNKLLLTAAYGYILFVHFSKWRDKLPLFSITCSTPGLLQLCHHHVCDNCCNVICLWACRH